MPDTTLQKLTRKNLLHGVRSIIGSELFRHLYVRNKTTGEEFDAVDDGQFSCALVVSSVLALNGLLDRPHATVTTTLKIMQENGWQKINQPKPGAIVEWAAHDSHAHIGFVLTETSCVSNSDHARTPIEHPFTMRDGREPIAYYWHNDLDN